MSGKTNGLVSILNGDGKMIIPVSATVHVQVDLTAISSVVLKTTVVNAGADNHVVDETYCLGSELFSYLWDKIHENKRIRDEASAALEV